MPKSGIALCLESEQNENLTDLSQVYFLSDPYVGSNCEEGKRKNARIDELEADVRKLKAEFDCNNNCGRDFDKGKKKRY